MSKNRKSKTINKKIFDALTRDEQDRILEAERKFEKNNNNNNNNNNLG